ncbi:amino acid transporter ANT1 [Dendrobium catenatum]|uniref:amino acid transporter ANT1 n=1 Tax=Dendrobium catenatum TaxID=906689 RepID=UPI0010A0A9F9|nr:amino acid transporter ANT1 [Dendrobium catenatum]
MGTCSSAQKKVDSTAKASNGVCFKAKDVSIPSPIKEKALNEENPVGLCIALAFTFPIILHPIYEIIEMKLASSGWSQKFCCNAHGERLGLHGARMLVLLIITTVASCIPGFGAFISLVGSTVSAMLAFVLPATFHLLLLGSKLKLWQRAVDYLILLVGIAFAGYGTYDALSHHLMGS